MSCFLHELKVIYYQVKESVTVRINQSVILIISDSSHLKSSCWPYGLHSPCKKMFLVKKFWRCRTKQFGPRTPRNSKSDMSRIFGFQHFLPDAVSGSKFIIDIRDYRQLFEKNSFWIFSTLSPIIPLLHSISKAIMLHITASNSLKNNFGINLGTKFENIHLCIFFNMP